MTLRKPPTLLAEAERDIEEAVTWYEAQAPGLGAAFLDHLDDLFRQIERRPMANPLVGVLSRRATLRGFPYSVIYRVLPDRIDVVSVLRSHPAPAQRLQSNML